MLCACASFLCLCGSKGDVRRQPAIAVPALTGGVAKARGLDLYWFAGVLGNFGPDAQSGVPALLGVWRTSQDEAIRASAAEALKTIPRA